MKIDGSCHCGKISFTAEVDPTRVSVCHCTDCQVLSGSPFRVSVAASVDRFELHGQAKRYVKVAQSGNHRVAQRAALAPGEQIWTASALPWVSRMNELPDAGQR